MEHRPILQTLAETANAHQSERHGGVVLDFTPLQSLQEIDLALDARGVARESAQRQIEDTEALDAAREALAEARSSQRELQGRTGPLEDDVADTKAKLEPLEAKLYDGSIKNPKELQELDHQVGTLKQIRDDQELRLLEHMSTLEDATRAVVAAQSALKETERSWQADQKRLGKEIEVLKREIAELDARRVAVVQTISAAIMQLYTHLRPRTGGKAVARVERGMCAGCRISLPLNIVSRARSGAGIVQCTSCQRILLPG